MEKDFTTLEGVKNAAVDLNVAATRLGLDLDISLRPDEANANATIFTKSGGVYHLEQSFYGEYSPAGIEKMFGQIADYLDKYSVSRKEHLAKRAADLEAELAEVRVQMEAAE